MKTKSILLGFCVTSMVCLTGCARMEEANERAEADRKAEIAVAKRIIKNREVYSKDIVLATNECIKASSSLTQLTASGNDQEEVVKVCSEVAQKAYGAYSPYFESSLQVWSVK